MAAPDLPLGSSGVDATGFSTRAHGQRAVRLRKGSASNFRPRPARFRARARVRGTLVPGAAGIPSSLLCLTLSTVTATWVACLWKVAEHLVKLARTLSWFCGDTMAGLKVGGPRFAPMPPDREACRKDAGGAWAAEGGRPGIPETDAASSAATRR